MMISRHRQVAVPKSRTTKIGVNIANIPLNFPRGKKGIQLDQRRPGMASKKDIMSISMHSLTLSGSQILFTGFFQSSQEKEYRCCYRCPQPPSSILEVTLMIGIQAQAIIKISRKHHPEMHTTYLCRSVFVSLVFMALTLCGRRMPVHTIVTRLNEECSCVHFPG